MTYLSYFAFRLKTTEHLHRQNPYRGGRDENGSNYKSAQWASAVFLEHVESFYWGGFIFSFLLCNWMINQTCGL